MKRCGWPTSTDSDSSPSTPSKRWPRSRRPTTASPKPSACSPPPTGSRRDRLRLALPEEQRTYERHSAPHERTPARRRTPPGRKGLTLDWLEAASTHDGHGANGAGPSMVGPITPTEQRVVDLVAEELTNPEIAERLLMARGTVKSHLEHIFAKTGYRNRAELAAAASKRQSQPHE